MAEALLLEEVKEEVLDHILSLPPEGKATYFKKLATKFYPKVDSSSDEFKNLVECYISSFYLEKMYRSNRFFNEKFVVIYTQTGLIRNVLSDLFYADDDLITH